MLTLAHSQLASGPPSQQDGMELLFAPEEVQADRELVTLAAPRQRLTVQVLLSVGRSLQAEAEAIVTS